MWPSHVVVNPALADYAGQWLEDVPPQASYVFAWSDVGVDRKHHRTAQDLEVPARVLTDEFYLREHCYSAFSERQIRSLHNLTGQPASLDQ